MVVVLLLAVLFHSGKQYKSQPFASTCPYSSSSSSSSSFPSSVSSSSGSPPETEMIRIQSARPFSESTIFGWLTGQGEQSSLNGGKERRRSTSKKSQAECRRMWLMNNLSWNEEENDQQQTKLVSLSSLYPKTCPDDSSKEHHTTSIWTNK